jgi:hypothetical protein
MSQQPVKWGQVKRYFENRGYEIVSRGGDKIIKAPADNNPIRHRQTVLIGHEYSDSAGTELARGHLSAIKRAFGVTRDEILNG